MPELAQAQKNVFGADAKLHPITLMPLEQGSGALPHDQQAMLHLQTIEETDGKEAADAMRRKLGVPTAEEIAEKAKAEAEAKALQDKRIMKALALLDQVEADEAAKAAAANKGS